MVNVAVPAQAPAFGVNVYVVVAVLFSAGDHVPLILLSEVNGRGESTSPEHIGAMALNAGVTVAPMEPTLMVAVPIQFFVSRTVTV